MNNHTIARLIWAAALGLALMPAGVHADDAAATAESAATEAQTTATEASDAATEAAAAASDAAQTLPEAASAKYAAVTEAISGEDFAAAKTALGEVLELAPEFPRAHFDLGFCEDKLKNHDAAATHYAKAYALEPTKADYGYAAGLAYYQAEDYAQAAQLLGQVTDADPEHGKAWLQLARAHEKQKAYDEAAAAATKATELAPEDASAYFQLGSIEYNKSLKTKSYDAATAAYEKALELDPKHVNAFAGHYKLGKLYYKQKNYADAKAQYEQAVKIRQDYPAAHLALGDAERKLKQHDAAVAAYQKAIELRAPEVYGLAYYKLGGVYQSQENWDGALEAFRQSLNDTKFRYAEKSRESITKIEDYLTQKKKAASSY